MPLITIVLFFIFVGALALFANSLKRRKKLKAIAAFGLSEFGIELPSSASINKRKERQFVLLNLSDREGFFLMVTPYIGSLSLDKREYLYQSINDLRHDLKINKEIYNYFIDEYKIYEGLSDSQAAEKWSGA